MVTTNAAPVLDGDARRLLGAVLPLGELDVRYLRKSVRYELGLRKTAPSRMLDAGRLTPERGAELDRLAQWIVQAGA